MKRNVVELDLFVNSRLHCHFFELPKSIFMCKTLMILKLRSNFTANNIPASGCNKKDSKYGADSEPYEGPKPRWRAPELVPSCLESNLETIYIEGFKGQLNTMEVAKYFLRNYEVLKKLTLSSDPLCEEMQALHKKLLMVPKVSKACVVNFV
ncbi:uncharacterized protein LOC112203441 [Rosa chinensis]|uniref:uncharacterized protein LOC112203441 n=1 Tax=Rosa chinensis TaxID=74649 RepID=UPI000D08C13A|nr:uncharacterized protein LOC112203441 [Rosa chinensis]